MFFIKPRFDLCAQPAVRFGESKLLAFRSWTEGPPRFMIGRMIWPNGLRKPRSRLVDTLPLRVIRVGLDRNSAPTDFGNTPEWSRGPTT
jgi:hypothetical protein